MTERRPVAFNKFGGLRLDLPLDEIGGEQAQYLRDVDWDGNTGRLRPRDGFAKLKAADASGPYKALFAHSALRLLATKRVSAESVKLVAIDKDGEEKAEIEWPATAATFCATRFGTPSASYTYCRANLPTGKVVRFDGTEFAVPTCTFEKVSPEGTTTETGKEMPRGKFMATWPDIGNCLVVANTGATGGPAGAASSNSHVWFSRPGDAGGAEAYEDVAYLQLSAGDGEEITGLAVFGGQLFVFKETRFFVVYGVSIEEDGVRKFHYREVSLGAGSQMKRPVVEALAESSDQLVCVGSDGVYFCTSDGVYVTTGSTPLKISQALRPLEEVSPFDGPMAEFLNGDTEVFRWPATGVACLGTRLIVRRYEFMFILDLPTGEWTCWKMPAVSMAIWTGLTGGGAETTGDKVAATAESSGTPAWSNPSNAEIKDETFATCSLASGQTSGKLILKNFGPNVPSGATIVGFGVTVWGEGGKTTISDVRLLREGVESSNLVLSPPSFVGYGARLFGGTESLGGLTWTPAQANAATSGVAVAVERNGGGTFTEYIDAVFLAVYYVTAEAASGVRPRLYCSQGKSVLVTQPSAAEDAGIREAEWQSGFYNMGSYDEKDLVGVRAFGAGTIDAQGFSDFDDQPSVSESHLEFPAGGNRSVLDPNGLTDSGVMFSHRLKLEPDSAAQSIIRYLRETRTPETKGR